MTTTQFADTGTPADTTGTSTSGHSGPTTFRWQSLWPVLAGATIGLGTAYGSTGPDVAPVVVASGFIYLAAAALGRPRAAWPAFLVTFVLIGVKTAVPSFDPTPWLLGVAAVLLGLGIARGRTRPPWGLPLQAVAMVVTGVAALVAGFVETGYAAGLVAVALLGHAVWDAFHLARRRVVVPSFALFCLVLDVVVAALVATSALV